MMKHSKKRLLALFMTCIMMLGCLPATAIASEMHEQNDASQLETVAAVNDETATEDKTSEPAEVAEEAEDKTAEAAEVAEEAEDKAAETAEVAEEENAPAEKQAVSQKSSTAKKMMASSPMLAAPNAANIAEGEGWYLDAEGCLHITGAVHNPVIGNTGSTPWTSYKSQIKTVVAEEGASVDSGQSLFYNCAYLTSADLSKLDTSNVTSMNAMFSECGNLTSADVSNFDTSNVTDMRSMFNFCTSLTELDVSKFDTSNVTDMSYMFAICHRLPSVDVSNFDTSNVTSMIAMFETCYDLTELDVSNFDTSNVTDMSCMFNCCESLPSVDVSKFDTSNVTSMWAMFSDCDRLTELDLSNFDTSNVTSMQGMFNACDRLTSVDVSNFDTSNVTDMSNMFLNCSKLTSVDVSKFDTSKVTNMRWMFNSCDKLTELDVSNFDTSNVTNMDMMFYACKSLTELDVSNFDTSNITDMNNLFGYCKSLTELDVSNFDTSNVTDMSEMFHKCANLTELDVSGNFFDKCTAESASVFETHPQWFEKSEPDRVYASTDDINAKEGVRKLVLKLKVEYVVADGIAPAAYNGEVPAVAYYLTNSNVSVAAPLTTTETTNADGIPGVWSFAWDKSDFVITADTTITGTWKFTPDTAYTVTYKVTGDAVYGIPGDSVTPTDSKAYCDGEEVTVKAVPTTAWTTSDGTAAGIPGVWSIAWDKSDFAITADTTITGAWKFDAAPELNAKDVTVKVGTPLDDVVAGMSATDAEDGDLSKQITVKDDGGYDANTPGTYEVTVSVKDSAGNEVEKTVAITVEAVPVDPVDPVDPETTDLRVTVRADNGKYPDSVTAYIYCDGKQVKQVVLNADNNWSVQIKDMPKGNYSVKAESMDGYSISYSNVGNEWTIKLTQNTPVDPDVPQTGDYMNIALYALVGLLSAFGIATMLIVGSKKNSYKGKRVA